MSTPNERLRIRSQALLPLAPLLALLLLSVTWSGAVAQPAEHASSDRSVGWAEIRPDGDTGCAFGTPYRFFFREGTDPTQLLVYFQGGGACWNWVSCSGMFDTSVDDDELERFAGVFDFERPENPFASYSVVFVPYCTGDVHVGDTVGRYGEPSWETTPVAHRGGRNVAAVVRWIASEVTPPERLVVAGASAGSYGALFHAPTLGATFPAAELTVIGDSGVPLLHGYARILDDWGGDRVIGAGGMEPTEGAERPVTLEEAHRRIARRRPDARIAQITTDRDAVQSAFYLISGSPDWREATLDLLETLEWSSRTFARSSSTATTTDCCGPIVSTRSRPTASVSGIGSNDSYEEGPRRVTTARTVARGRLSKAGRPPVAGAPWRWGSEQVRGRRAVVQDRYGLTEVLVRVP